jgi:hypothetical protein
MLLEWIFISFVLEASARARSAIKSLTPDDTDNTDLWTKIEIELISFCLFQIADKPAKCVEILLLPPCKKKFLSSDRHLRV